MTNLAVESALSAPRAFEMNGAERMGAVPAAASVRLVVFKNRRRETDLVPVLLILRSSSVLGSNAITDYISLVVNSSLR